MALKGARKSTKSPPVLSHEFVIQNHADIVSCIAMVFVLGLMFQSTAPFSSIFITLQYNTTSHEDTASGSAIDMKYTNGARDMASVFFYGLICIIMHAIIQEYILDKINRRLHLSKTKHSKFNESGQLLIFTAFSTFWGANIVMKDNLLPEISALWHGYPESHAEMSFMLKFFFIIQLSYWIHCYPELYFQKVKKDEVFGRVQYATLYLIFVTGAYVLNFTHIAMVLLLLKYGEEMILHFCRLFYFAEKSSISNPGFRLWNGLFVICRLASIILSLLTFHYGLAKSEDQVLNLVTGNFNTPLIRLNALAAVCLVQAWMIWNFIHFQLRRMRDRQAAVAAYRKKAAEKRAKKSKKEDSKRSSEEDELPEVDQNTRRRK